MIEIVPYYAIVRYSDSKLTVRRKLPSFDEAWTYAKSIVMANVFDKAAWPVEIRFEQLEEPNGLPFN